MSADARQRLQQGWRETEMGDARRERLSLVGLSGFEQQARISGFIAGKNFEANRARADAEHGVQRRFLLGGFAILGGQKGFLRFPDRLGGAFALTQQIGQIVSPVAGLAAKVAGQHLAEHQQAVANQIGPPEFGLDLDLGTSPIQRQIQQIGVDFTGWSGEFPVAVDHFGAGHIRADLTQ